MAADNSLVKKPHIQQRFTSRQIDEFAKCADPDNGYLYFMQNYYYIQHPTKGKLLFAPYDYQLGLLSSYHNHRNNINMMPRQSGKCLADCVTIQVKHNITGEIHEIPIGDFFSMQKSKGTNK
jgi:hypothetical protein